MSRAAIIARLRQGPATNRDLQRATDNYWSGGISRTVAKLIADGRVTRIDGRSGRGKPATYALKEQGQ